MNKALTLLGGIGIGTALMYALDPDMGRRRRATVRDKAVSAWNTAGDAVSKTGRDIANRAKGVASEARGMFRREEISERMREAREQASHRASMYGLRRNQWPPAWRVVAGATGGALTFYGLKHRGPLGAAASAAGISMIARSTTNRQAKKLFGLIGRAA